MKTQTTICPTCQKHYPCPGFMVGKTIKCECGHDFVAAYAPEETSQKTTTTSPQADIPYNGKINASSAGVLDDQAKLVFDYFKVAAERIINDEDRITAEIKANETAKSAAENTAKSSKTLAIVFGAIGVIIIIIALFTSLGLSIIGLGLGIYAFTLHLKVGKSLAEAVRLTTIIGNLQADFKAIKRDYSINKLGVVYVPVASRIPFEDKSFLLDHTEMVPQKEFSLYMIRDQNGFVDSVKSIDSLLEQVPLVEGSAATEKLNTTRFSKSVDSVTYYDYLGGLDRNMRSASFQIADQNKISVALPIIMPNADLASKLSEFGTEEIGKAKVVSVFSTSAYDQHLKKFMELNELRKSLAAESRDFERFLEELIQRVAKQVQLLSKLKLRTASGMVAYTNELLLLSFKASYNHYSKELEAEEIERIRTERFDYHEAADSYKPFQLKPSSHMSFDLLSMNWVAEDGSRSSFPFGVHQIQEEVVAPIVEALMQETRIERMKVYSNIKDQKLDYLNQWHRDVDDFYGRGRGEAHDIVNLMQATITELTTAISQYRAFDGAEKDMANGDLENTEAGLIKEDQGSAMMSVAACESQVSQIRTEEAEYNAFVLRLKDDIDRRSGLFGHVKFYDASLRDELSHELAASNDLIPEMDPRRRVLLKVNALVAHRAKLPPRPDLHGQVNQDVGINLEAYAAGVVRELQNNGAALPAAEVKQETP